MVMVGLLRVLQIPNPSEMSDDDDVPPIKSTTTIKMPSTSEGPTVDAREVTC